MIAALKESCGGDQVSASRPLVWVRIMRNVAPEAIIAFAARAAHSGASVGLFDALLSEGTMPPPKLATSVNVCTSPGAERHFSTVPYHAVKAAMDRLAVDMAEELRPHGVAAVSLWPSFTKTESILADQHGHDLSGAATPQFTGRAIAALAADPNVLEKSGRALPVLELAREYGFTDVDGSLPDR